MVSIETFIHSEESLRVLGQSELGACGSCEDVVLRHFVYLFKNGLWFLLYNGVNDCIIMIISTYIFLEYSFLIFLLYYAVTFCTLMFIVSCKFLYHLEYSRNKYFVILRTDFVNYSTYTNTAVRTIFSILRGFIPFLLRFSHNFIFQWHTFFLHTNQSIHIYSLLCSLCQTLLNFELFPVTQLRT